MDVNHRTSKKPVTDFLKNYPNKKTRANYRIAITHYLHSVCTASRNGKFSPADILAERYLQALNTKQRNHYADLKEYAHILNKKYAPTTTHLYLSLTMFWLDENGYPTNRKERGRITSQLPPAHPRERDLELKRKTFRTLYHNFPEDIAVLLLVLLASGMRLGEALALKRDNVNWSKGRTEIYLPAAICKTKTARRTYLTEEASYALLEYLRSRRDYDERLFLITYDRAQQRMRETSIRLGLSKTIDGRRCVVHWHMTRKWFISRFALAANKEIAEHLAGHEGYLTRSYRRYSKKQLLKEYAKAEKKLSILKRYEY